MRINRIENDIYVIKRLINENNEVDLAEELDEFERELESVRGSTDEELAVDLQCHDEG